MSSLLLDTTADMRSISLSLSLVLMLGTVLQVMYRSVVMYYTVLALKFVYYLNGERATLIYMLEDISILAYEKVIGS
jgi:hypothetical protein